MPSWFNLALETAGITSAITRVQTRNEFVSALERGGTDLIFSDFDLPAFDAMSAMELVRSRWPIIPVILVSGSLDQKLTIDSLKSGAVDCVPKKDLFRLPTAVRRAMQQVEEQAVRRRLELQVIEAQKMEVISQLSSGVKWHKRWRGDLLRLSERRRDDASYLDQGRR